VYSKNWQAGRCQDESQGNEKMGGKFGSHFHDDVSDEAIGRTFANYLNRLELEFKLKDNKKAEPFCGSANEHYANNAD
jgi:hypothetical protein